MLALSLPGTCVWPVPLVSYFWVVYYRIAQTARLNLACDHTLACAGHGPLDRGILKGSTGQVTRFAALRQVRDGQTSRHRPRLVVSRST
jgi:hypothetical protein